MQWFTKTLWATLFLALSVGYVFAQENFSEKVNNLLVLKEYAKAEQLLLAVKKAQKTPQIKELLADTYAYQGKWDAAISIYKDLTESFPKNPQYHFKHGGALGRKAQNVSRLTALTLIGGIKRGFQNAAKLDKTHIDARWGLIEYYLAIPGFLGGGIKKCKPYAKELLEISPVEGYFAKAYLHELEGEDDKAKNSYLNVFKNLHTVKNIERNQLNFLIGKVCSEFEREEDKGIDALLDFIAKHSVRDGVPVSLAHYHLAKLYRLKKDKKAANFWINKVSSTKVDALLISKEKAKIYSL